MLIYDPTLDPYHCAVRILAILKESAIAELQIEAVRIADFYLAHPAQLAAMRLPQQHRRIRTAANRLATPYRRPSSVRGSFERMRPIFMAAISGLAATGLLASEKLRTGIVTRTERPLPPTLVKAVEEFLTRQSEIKHFVTTELLGMQLLGAGGLKDRSGLMEYRYDVA